MPVRPNANNSYEGVLAPPDGFRWGQLPQYYAPSDVVPGTLRMRSSARGHIRSWRAAVRTLIEWATQHDIFVTFYDTAEIPSGGIRFTQFQVHPMVRRGRQRGRQIEISTPTTCPCGREIQPWEAACTCGTRAECTECGYHLWPDRPRIIDGRLGCSRCFRPCGGLNEDGTICQGAVTSSRLRLCSAHENVTTMRTCAGCNEPFDNRVMPETNIGGQSFDPDCSRNRCWTCAVLAPNGARQPHRDHQDRPQCEPCNTRMNRWFVASSQRTSLQQYIIEPLPNRPVRLVSMELEFCQGPSNPAGTRPGDVLAQRLYDSGLTPYNQQMRYHCGMHNHPAHVENDSSVDGGELILNRLRLDQAEDAGHFASILGHTQTMLEEQRLVFNARCGVHTHVDMHGYGILDARNLVTTYNYLEDVIYRFASAGYRDHRALINGSDYARPLLKGEWPTAREFGVSYLQQANHRDSLNMEHFFKAWQLCQCGAIQFGSPDECTCNRPKCTAEWRVFNGTNDPRTLWAWIVFVQSLTAWCQGRDLDPSEFEPLGFENGINFMDENLGDSHHNLIEAWKSRLDWIFRNLVFTEQEQDTILDVMMTTPLIHIGVKEFTRLRNLRATPEERTLTVPYIAARRAPNQQESSYHQQMETYLNRFDTDDGYCELCGESESYCGCEEPVNPNPQPRRNRSSNRFLAGQSVEWSQVQFVPSTDTGGNN